METYTEADWEGSKLDRRSTTIYCSMVGKILGPRKTKKQTMVSKTSSETKWQEMALKTCDLLWLQIFYIQLEVIYKGPLMLHSNSTEAQQIATNPVLP